MTDAVDQAQRFDEMRRDIALAGVRDQARRQDAERGTLVCLACFDAIEPERLAVCPGARRCLLCQEAAERFHKLSAR